jgi:hypothetical protein
MSFFAAGWLKNQYEETEFERTGFPPPIARLALFNFPFSLSRYSVAFSTRC